MAKQGMKRPEVTHSKPRNEAPPVPEIQGKAKTGNEKANPIIEDTRAPELKVYHTVPHKSEDRKKADSAAYPVFDSGLAEENLESDMDMTAADLQDL